MKLKQAAVNLCVTAHIWSWGVFLILLLWPSFWRETSNVTIRPDGSRSEIVRDATSIVEAKGRWVLVPLLAPVALTALGLVVARTWDGKRLANKVLMWGLVAALLIFSGLATYYLSTFHLLESLLLLASAIAISLKSNPTVRPGTNP